MDRCAKADLDQPDAPCTGGRLDDRRWHLFLATEHGGERRCRRRPDRLGNHRHRHADPRPGVPDAGQPQARARHRRLRLCQGGLRRLHGLLLGVGLLDQRLDRQRQLPGAAVQYPGAVLPGLRRRQYRTGHRLRFAAPVGHPFRGAQRHSRSGLPQPGHDHRQGRTAGAVHRHCGAGLQDRGVHGRFLGYRQSRAWQRAESGARDDAGHRLGVHRDRGGQHLLGTCRAAPRYRQGHRHRLLFGAAASGAGQRAVDGDSQPTGTCGAEEPLHGWSMWSGAGARC